jgi:RimJ/RimL family protein N-acetyltransferase
MLAGERVCLGPLVRADAPLVFGWLNIADNARFNGSYRPADETKFDRWFAGVGADPARVVFAIRAKRDMRLLGFLQIVDINAANRSGVLGILIGAAGDQGHGFGQEAIRLAVEFSWRELNLQRLTLFVHGDNPRALSAYRKAGFEIEGTMRRAAYVDGRLQDITIMGLLRQESVSLLDDHADP